MVLKRKGFFLNLEESADAGATPPVQVAPVKDPVAKDTSGSKTPVAKSVPTPSVPATGPSDPAPAAETGRKPALTTAEAIAAELAAAEAARPAMTIATYAPEALRPDQALRPQRRRPGANLKGFRSMAADLFKS